jgi:CubicO group peptidase (beta-lactamase class C family)
MRIQLFLFILAGIFVSAAGSSQTIQSLFAEAQSKGFSGEMLVAENGKVKMHEVAGYRRFEDKKPLKKGDIFELASVSKQFTAMIIMMLAEKGKLTIDDSLSKFVATPYTGITIRHLLTHTSGLPDYQAIMDQHWDKSKVAGNADIIEYLNKYSPPRQFAPGEKYAYSNTGYVLLASIAEKASGQDFIELCRQWIFRPLKMKHTDIRTLDQKAAEKRFALGHLKDSAGNYVNANRFHSSDYTVWLGNRKGPGRISSTASDLLKWDRALYGSKLVSAKMLQQAFTPGKDNAGQNIRYGFGWVIDVAEDGSVIVKHNGDNPGYSTQIVRLLGKRRTLILLCNNAYAGFSNLVKNVEAMLQNESAF